MKCLLFVILSIPCFAHADLYRWVDPETGAVKFSSYPPRWLGDPERGRNAPAVEVVPYRGSPAPVKPAKPAAQPVKPPVAAGTPAALEERRASLLRFFATLPPNFDYNRDGAAVQQQLAAYQAASAELDRLDPGGAQRRRAEETIVFEPLRRRLPQ
jgi:hypothetical protein